MDKNLLMQVSSGEIPADLVLKNGQIINVFSERIITADVAIKDGIIAGIGTYQGREEIDCTGRFIAPGFIDAHIHIESTMVMPCELSKILLKSGTTTIIADPHEMVNVSGQKALDFLIETTKHIPLNVYIMVPSSVPATKFDTNGSGEFLATDMEPYVSYERILGLGEVMCFLDVIHREPKALEKLKLFERKIADGHAPGIRGKEVQTYRLAGIDNDHECVTFEEALEKLEAGFHILIREGSGAKDLDALIRGFIEQNIPLDGCAFCTDDRHLADMEQFGHISNCIRKAISHGLSPVKAIKIATYHAAKIYGLKNLGAVSAGCIADLVVLSDLSEVITDFVVKDGQVVTEKFLTTYCNPVIQPELLHTVTIPVLTAESIGLKRNAKNHVIEMIPGQLITNHLFELIPGEGTLFYPNKEFNKLCVIERHGKSGSFSVSCLKGFGIEHAAIATSVSHDSHNIIVAGDNDLDILLAVNELEKIQGGFVIASKGKILGALSLPLFGLMSVESYQAVQHKTGEMLQTAYSLGISKEVDPFITLSFLALPVIPHLRLLDQGLFDVDAFQMIPTRS